MANMNLKEGDIVRISGDLNLADYNCRVDTNAEILEDSSSRRRSVYCRLFYIDGDSNVCVYVNKKYIREKVS